MVLKHYSYWLSQIEFYVKQWKRCITFHRVIIFKVGRLKMYRTFFGSVAISYIYFIKQSWNVVKRTFTEVIFQLIRLPYNLTVSCSFNSCKNLINIRTRGSFFLKWHFIQYSSEEDYLCWQKFKCRCYVIFSELLKTLFTRRQYFIKDISI